jgi:tetratricopeptide (TPR) repeat protein
MHRPNEALKYGEILVDKQPLSHDGYQLLGDAYFELSNLQKARECYEKALDRVTPNFRQFILSALSKTYEALGMPQEAADAYSEYLELSDKDPLSNFHAANLERLRMLQNQAAASKQE